MNITVIIPTYRRPEDLKRCLDALKAQIRLPNEVLVVVRDSDRATCQFLQAFNLDDLYLRSVKVFEAGVVAAMNAGLGNATGDVIVFTDDDSLPHGDWLAKIESHYLSDDQVGGVGGRDFVYHGSALQDGKASVVGRITWFGRVIGNHHIGCGLAREVDVLKGVNMSFRRSAVVGLRFDHRLRGAGAQAHFEIAFSLSVKRLGWKLIYDPSVAVNHYPAQRFDEDQRDTFNAVAWSNRVYNETFSLGLHLPTFRRFAYCIWSTLVGHRANWGLLQYLRFVSHEPSLAFVKLALSHQARRRAMSDLRL